MPNINWNEFTSDSTSTSSPASNSVDWSQFTQSVSNDSPIQEKSLVDKVADPIIAYGSGVRKGSTDLLGDVGTFAAELLNQLTPIRKIGDKWANKGREVVGSLDKADQEMFGKIQEENPVATALGKGTGYVGAALSIPNGGKTLPGQMATQGLLGAAMAGPGARVQGFAGGALLPALVSGITSSPSAYLAANASAGGEIKQAVSSINKAPEKYGNMNIYDATNESFARFKNTPGEIDTGSLQQQSKELLERYKERLSPKQVAAIEDLQNDLNNAKTLEDLHETRKAFTKDFGKVFLKGDSALYGKTRTGAIELNKALENVLQENAQKLGVLDQYKEANTLYKQSKEADILNTAFKKTELPEGGNNWLNFNRNLLSLKKEMASKLSPETKQVIDGIRNTLMEANHIYGIDTNGMILFQPVIRTIKTLAEMPVMRPTLQYLGTPGGRHLSKKFLKIIVNKVQAQYLESRADDTTSEE
jgi:hypothetical protein